MTGILLLTLVCSVKPVHFQKLHGMDGIAYYGMAECCKCKMFMKTAPFVFVPQLFQSVSDISSLTSL
jgi:hypothetical protein